MTKNWTLRPLFSLPIGYGLEIMMKIIFYLFHIRKVLVFILEMNCMLSKRIFHLIQYISYKI